MGNDIILYVECCTILFSFQMVQSTRVIIWSQELWCWGRHMGCGLYTCRAIITGKSGTDIITCTLAPASELLKKGLSGKYILETASCQWQHLKCEHLSVITIALPQLSKCSQLKGFTELDFYEYSFRYHFYQVTLI